MAQYSRPSPDNGRVVTDDDYEALTLGYAVDGLIGSTADTYPVYADSTGRQVKVRAGKRALVRGYLWGADPSSDETIATTTNTSGNPRIDRLVLRLDRTTHNVRTALLTGTPGASPAAPALTQNTSTSGMWEFPLARWQVASGYTTIAAGDIQPEGWYTIPDGSIVWPSTVTGWAPAGSALRAGLSGFEADSGFMYRYNGTKWLRNNDEQVVTTDQQWLNTTTYAAMSSGNVTPNRSQGLGFPVASSSRYAWELRLLYVGVNNVALAVRSTFPSGSRLDVGFIGYTSTGGAWNVNTSNITSSPAAHGAFGPGPNGNFPVLQASGTILTGSAAGSFAFEFAQGTANGANGSWVLVGTSLRHRQIS